MSLSEGNAKTCLEQSPVTDSPKAYGPHKSTVTTQRKSVKSVQSVQSVVKKEPQALRCLEGTTLSNRGQRPRIYDTPPYLCLEGSTPQDRKRFISVYRLGEDGDLL